MSTGFPSLTHERRAFPLPTVSEDTLEYALHLPPSLATGADEAADATALATLVSREVERLLPQPWLWNKDAWELKVAPTSSAAASTAAPPSASASPSKPSPAADDDTSSSAAPSASTAAQATSKLEGRMRVGDAVDDEWLVVWLLVQVSQAHPDLAISVRDSDGEFLLIEAAHALPAWVAPENATNRFWLMGGRFHLLPLSVRSSGRPQQISDADYDDSGHAVDASAWVSEDDALRALRANPDKYRVSDGVQAAIDSRISKYPAALKTHQQHTKAYLPEKIARALSADPALVQRAAEAFYVRDPAQLRQAARMAAFPPQDAILASVTMTRTAYAQLRGQVFHPPRAFGPEWHVPDSAGEDEARWRDLGVKISTGFEILYREGGRGRSGATEGDADPAALAKDPEYGRYIRDLRAAGFFGDEREGSARWHEQEAKAAKGWVDARSKDNAQDRPSFAFLVDRAVDSTRDQPASAFETNKVDGEDSDAWLEVDPHELDALMARVAGGSDQNQVSVGEEDGKALAALADKMQAFFGGEGDLGGARFADELDDENMTDSDSDSDDDRAREPEPETEPELTERQRQERLARLVQPLDASEWGQRTQAAPPAMDVDGADEAGAPGLVAGSRAGDALLPRSMRPPRFAKQEYDGVVSESSDEDSGDERAPEGSIGRHVLGMRWADGAPTSDAASAAPRSATIEEIPSDGDKDEDEDDEDRARKTALALGDIDEEMNRRAWGLGTDEDGKDEDADADVDMGDEEGDFLEFSRQALGLSDEQWADILRERKDRGAYVPSPAAKKPAGPAPPPPSAPAAASTSAKVPNQSLDSFESMMKAMEQELARHRQGNDEPMPEQSARPTFKKPAARPATDKTATPPGKAQRTGIRPGKGKASKFQRLQDLPSEADLDDMDDEQLAAMDAELRLALDGHSDDEDDMPELAELDDSGRQQYGMMKNLLESYRSQGGQSGVVGNLFGRLGEKGRPTSDSKK